MYQYMLGATQMKSGFAQKDLGVLLDTRLNVSHEVPLPQRRLVL